jgi:hypothetical protein
MGEALFGGLTAVVQQMRAAMERGMERGMQRGRNR